ncbi:hypothetical protein U3516DRAFT_569741 [Neocallimastix sp. 'constans']
MNLFSINNATRNRNGFFSSTEASLNRRSKTYDIYVFDPIYTKDLSSHFIDLKELLPREYLDSYSLNNIKDICVYENKWVGLPLFIKFMILYSNKNYLENYNKEIPKTWNELLETGQYIINQEKMNNNNNIYGYNGLFGYNSVSSMCSIYQFMYSYRDSKDSPFPEIKSKNSVNALKKFKEIKEKISSDEIYEADDEYTIDLLNRGDNLLFAVYWNSIYKFDEYDESILPGGNEDISGSCLGGYNIGVNKYIDKDKKEASAKVLEYIFSKEFQKEIVIKTFKQYSGIMELYENEEVCSILNCDMMNKNQFINRPTHTKNYEHYEYKFLKYIDRYLYEDEDPKDILQNIENITKMYYMKFKDSLLGIVVFITINIFFMIVLSSYILSLTPKYKPYYSLYSGAMWLNYIISSIFIIYSPLTKFGKPTSFKCHAFYLLLLNGYTMLYAPSVSLLVANNPKFKNKFIDWVKNNESTFINLIYVVEGIFVILSAINPSYTVLEVITEDDRNFYQCNIDKNDTFGLALLYLEVSFHIILFSFFVIFTLIDWEIEPIHEIVKTKLYFSAVDGLSFLLAFIIYILDTENYYIDSLYPLSILLVLIVKHIYLFYVRILFSIDNNNTVKEREIVKDSVRTSGKERSNNQSTKGTTDMITQNSIKNSNNTYQISNTTDRNSNTINRDSITANRNSIISNRNSINTNQNSITVNQNSNVTNVEGS